jgi:SAM-dependent methyltransferase
VQVWATDLWISASENLQRIRDAGVEDGVFPLHADSRALPFAAEFFDAIVCVDAFYYFGTDDLYLNYLAQFVKPGGPVGIAGAGLVQEIDGPIVGIGSGQASWTLAWPTPCLRAGSCGWNGIGPGGLTTARKSARLKPIMASTSDMSVSQVAAGATQSWKTTAGPIR